MTTFLIVAGILFVFLLGLVKVFKHHNHLLNNFDFAYEYRNKFVEFSNKYFENSNIWGKGGNLDNELYIWLTKNISKIQNNLGIFGIMDYVAPFQIYHVPNYQIIVNTIPKFRAGNVQSFDVNSVDDCLLRYIGHTEERIKCSRKNLRNPLVWFRNGFQEVISLPLFVLNWFGIFSRRTVDSVMESTIFKVITGIIALVTFISGIVTIIQGKEQTIDFIKKILGK
jgi:hypothetical protein